MIADQVYMLIQDALAREQGAVKLAWAAMMAGGDNGAGVLVVRRMEGLTLVSEVSRSWQVPWGSVAYADGQSS